MPFFKINPKDARIYQGKTRTTKSAGEDSSGISGSAQILHTPGYTEGTPAYETGELGAMVRIPGVDGFTTTLAGYTPVYPGGQFYGLDPYDQVRTPQRIQFQSASFYSGIEEDSALAQHRDGIQKVWMPQYAARYGARYENSVLNQKVLALSRPILTPVYPFSSYSQGNEGNYTLTDGFSSFAHVKIVQDDIGSADVYQTGSTVFTSVSPPADITVSRGLTPVMAILSASWSGFASGSSPTDLETLTGIQVPFVSFAWGVNRDDTGARRLFVLAATGSGQTDVFQAQSEALPIELNEWNHLGVRWQETINNRTGSFVFNGNNVGDFILDVTSIVSPTTGNWLPILTYTKPLVSNFAEIGNLSSSVDGILTLGNIGQFRLSGSHPSGCNYPEQLGSAKLVEMHDIVLWDKFVELEDVEPFLTSSVSYEEASQPIFYVPVMAPRTKIRFNPVEDGLTLWGSLTIDLANILPYYVSSSVGGLFSSGNTQLYMEESHYLSVAQIGADVVNGVPNSSMDGIQRGGSIAGTIFENVQLGPEQGVFWNNDRNPFLGYGSQLLQNIPLTDIAGGNFALPIFIASGTFAGLVDGYETVIPSNPMDLITPNTSASYAPATMRIWPSDNHAFSIRAEYLNTWYDHFFTTYYTDAEVAEDEANVFIPNTLLLYSDFEFRDRHPAASNQSIIDVVPNSISYLTNSVNYANPFNDQLTTLDHFFNTSFNGNNLIYLPKVFSGDSIERGSPVMTVQPGMSVDSLSASFGTFSSSYTDPSVDSYLLTFVDNGYGGLVRATGSNGEQYNSIGCVFYDRGAVYPYDPTMLWIGNGSEANGNTWSLYFTSSNNAYIREMEMTIPQNAARYSTNPNDEFDLFTGVDVMDSCGNILERVAIAQPVARLSGSAVTIRTLTIF